MQAGKHLYGQLEIKREDSQDGLSPILLFSYYFFLAFSFFKKKKKSWIIC